MNRLFFASALASLAACSPSNGGNTSTMDAATDTGVVTTGDGSVVATPDGSTFAGLPNEELYCGSVVRPTCMPGSVASCGVCVPNPVDPLRRTLCSDLPDDPDYCDPGTAVSPPNFSCYATPPVARPSQMVTVWGTADVFGNGSDTNNVTIQIFATNADGTPGAMLGQATAISDMADARYRFSGLKIIYDSSHNETARRNLGGFSIPNIPTETPVIIKTFGSDDTYRHPIYDYTLAIRNSVIGAVAPPAAAGITGAAVKIRPRVISNGDWLNIPSTATLTSGIAAGEGAIAGEVHDCDDVRLSNAIVYATPEPDFASTVYFSDNPTNPVPDGTRGERGTTLLGLYALLDAHTGPFRVSSVGLLDGRTIHTGSYTAQVFAGAVTVVSFRGLQPSQLPAH